MAEDFTPAPSRCVPSTYTVNWFCPNGLLKDKQMREMLKEVAPKITVFWEEGP